MTKKIQIPTLLFYINSVIFFLSIFTLFARAETNIIAKSGDTLLKISRRYGVPLKELMYINNYNDASKLIEGAVIIVPDRNNNKDNKNKHLTYQVIEGDTLYKIARDYNVNPKDIISLNNLSNDSYLRLNQIIILPNSASYKKVINSENIKLASKKVFYHKTSKTEDLSTIAKIHNISIEEINTLNKLSNQIKINPNKKLKLREHKALKWLKYGSLMINWSDWTYLDGNYISAAKTEKNTSFFLALNCKKRVLNNTLNNYYWTSWYFPKTDFEFKLINDFCDKDFNF